MTSEIRNAPYSFYPPLVVTKTTHQAPSKLATLPYKDALKPQNRRWEDWEDDRLIKAFQAFDDKKRLPRCAWITIATAVGNGRTPEQSRSRLHRLKANILFTEMKKTLKKREFPSLPVRLGEQNDDNSLTDRVSAAASFTYHPSNYHDNLPQNPQNSIRVYQNQEKESTSGTAREWQSFFIDNIDHTQPITQMLPPTQGTMDQTIPTRDSNRSPFLANSNP